MKNILLLIKNSVYGTNGKESSTRIMAYSISIIAIIFCLVFIGIEISAAIIALHGVGKYVISNEIIIIFGSILAQQLALLGINKNFETKQFNIKESEKPAPTVTPPTVTPELDA